MKIIFREFRKDILTIIRDLPVIPRKKEKIIIDNVYYFVRDIEYHYETKDDSYPFIIIYLFRL